MSTRKRQDKAAEVEAAIKAEWEDYERHMAWLDAREKEEGQPVDWAGNVPDSYHSRKAFQVKKRKARTSPPVNRTQSS